MRIFVNLYKATTSPEGEQRKASKAAVDELNKASKAAAKTEQSLLALDQKIALSVQNIAKTEKAILERGMQTSPSQTEIAIADIFGGSSSPTLEGLQRTLGSLRKSHSNLQIERDALAAGLSESLQAVKKSRIEVYGSSHHGEHRNSELTASPSNSTESLNAGNRTPLKKK